MVSSAIVFPFSVPVVQLLVCRGAGRRSFHPASAGKLLPQVELRREATLPSMTSSPICTRSPPTTAGSTMVLTRSARPYCAARPCSRRSSWAVAERRRGRDRRDRRSPRCVGDDGGRVRGAARRCGGRAGCCTRWRTIATVCGEALPREQPLDERRPSTRSGPSLLPSASSSSASDATARSKAKSSASIGDVARPTSARRADAELLDAVEQVGRVRPARSRRCSVSSVAASASSSSRRPRRRARASARHPPRRVGRARSAAARRARSTRPAARSSSAVAQVGPAERRQCGAASPARASLVALPMATCFPPAAASEASRSARKRSTMAVAFLSSVRLSPMTPDARSMRERADLGAQRDERGLALGLDLRLRARGDAGGLGRGLLLGLGDDLLAVLASGARGCGRPRRARRRAGRCTPRARPRPCAAPRRPSRCCPRWPRRARRAASGRAGARTSRRRRRMMTKQTADQMMS